MISNVTNNIKQDITLMGNKLMIKLATVIQKTSSFCIDVLAIQEVRQKSKGLMIFHDEMMMVTTWHCHKHKREHGIAILLVPRLSGTPPEKIYLSNNL